MPTPQRYVSPFSLYLARGRSVVTYAVHFQNPHNDHSSDYNNDHYHDHYYYNHYYNHYYHDDNNHYSRSN